ncbi:hypothetical protein [Actinoplanes sp. URMC 104]|uniref:hypothetical protein n=1 Tax=Actinoplanes sp. URMC 104 TaxID=3423409 RepID=UPI003F1BDAC8
MTVAAHNNHPHVTDGEHVRGGVRGPETARVLPIRPDIDPRTARTRAISRSPVEIQANKTSKIRNFASTHAEEARDAAADSWLAHSRLRPLGDTARDVLHPHGAADVLAGPFRLAVEAIAHLLHESVATNKRAAVTFTLLVLSLATAWAIAAYAS